MKITEALNSLIKTQNENTTPNSDVLNAIFSLSQKELEGLNLQEKAAVSKLYQKVSDTDLVRRPDWAKPFLAFQKAFPIFQKTISNENDPTREQIQRGLTRHTSGPMHDIFMRMQAFLEDPSKPLDLSNLDLDSLPSFLLTDSRFAEANISGNNINKLPNIKIGALCNEKIYEEMVKQTSKKKPKMDLPVGTLVTTFSFLEELPPILEENKDLIKAAGASYQERIRKLLKEDPWLSRFIPKDFSLETPQEHMTTDFVNQAEVCLTSFKEAKDRQETSLVTVFPKILKKLSQASQTAWKDNVSWTQTQKAQAIRAYLTDHKEDCLSITDLDLSLMDLTEMPLEIYGFINLESLSLSYNNLQTLPPEIGNLSNLQTLNLSSSKLQIVPPEIGNLSRLEKLNLSGNKLQILPPKIGNLSSLQNLDLSYNNLQTLPSEIGNLSSLQYLFSSENRLEVLPPEIGNLTNLLRLQLSYNNLQTLPAEIRNLTNLIWLSIPASSLLEESVNEFRIRLQIPQGCEIVAV